MASGDGGEGVDVLLGQRPNVGDKYRCGDEVRVVMPPGDGGGGGVL